MFKSYTALLVLFLAFLPKAMESQEIRIFKIEDFDLMGDVKSCLVTTTYGKEEYEFGKNGLLTKSVTRFNDTDYDITYYKYVGTFLAEKRFENYRNTTFDPTTSIANIYTVDSTSNIKITEKIVSYDNEFLDQYEYFFSNDSLHKIIRTNTEGIDETLITYADIKGEQTKTYSLNDAPLESVRISVKKEKDSIIEKTILTKKFLKGEPISAKEEVFNGYGKVKLETTYFFNHKTKQFAKENSISYAYDVNGMLLSTESGLGVDTHKKEFIYQFDPNGNWVKEIITPDNSYTTRKIVYHEVLEKKVTE